jgi:hypothetical protein
MKKERTFALAALVAAASLAAAQPAHAAGIQIDGNGWLSTIMSWFAGGDEKPASTESDYGIAIDPNG